VKARLELIDQERKIGIYRNSQSQDLYGLVFCSECGLPWRSVEEFDIDILADMVEKIIVKPDGTDVVMKYQQAANS
jgi:hypothetical protein